jgi:hypothetical protein
LRSVQSSRRGVGPVVSRDDSENPFEEIGTIQAIDRRIRFFNFGIAVIWLGLIGSSIFTYKLLERGDVTYPEAGDFSSGTVGILATVLSILYLIKSLQAGERQRAVEAIEAGLESRKARIENLLAARKSLFSGAVHSNPPGAVSADASLQNHVEKLLDRAGSYVRIDVNNANGEGKAGVGGQIKEDLEKSLLPVLTRDPYINHMASIFASLGYSSRGDRSLRLEMVDHVWNLISLEERALLFICSFVGFNELPLPRDSTIDAWRFAVEARLPWNFSKFGLENLLSDGSATDAANQM